MEFPVVHLGQTIGKCTVTDQGLYWLIECQCEILSDRVERLYYGDARLGVLEKQGKILTCRRRLSKASAPSFSGRFSLSPDEYWEGTLLGQQVKCRREGDTLLFPYETDQPCPCEPLICFFEIKDGFWRLPVRKEWLLSAGDDSSCA